MGELIKMEKQVVTDNEVFVSSDSTIWVQAKNIEPVDIDGLLKKRQDVVSKIKSLSGMCVKFNSGMKKKLLDFKESYADEVIEYKVLFEQLKNGWEKKLEGGVFTGCWNDQELKRLGVLAGEVRSCHNRNTVISRVHQIVYRLNEVMASIERYEPKQGREVTVYL